MEVVNLGRGQRGVRVTAADLAAFETMWPHSGLHLPDEQHVIVTAWRVHDALGFLQYSSPAAMAALVSLAMGYLESFGK